MLRVTGLCVWNSPVTGEFPAHKDSDAEKVFIWWRHHAGWLQSRQDFMQLMVNAHSDKVDVSEVAKELEAEGITFEEKDTKHKGTDKIIWSWSIRICPQATAFHNIPFI